MMNIKTITATPVSNPTINAARVQALLDEAHGSDEYRAKRAVIILTTAFEGLMKKVVNGFHTRVDAFDDYMSEAKYAFLVAIEKFDASKGVPFAVYAASVMRYGILDYTKSDKCVHMPENVLADLAKVQEARMELEQDCATKVTDKELAKKAGISVSRVANARKAECCNMFRAKEDEQISAIIDRYTSPVESVYDGVERSDCESTSAYIVRSCEALCGKEKASFVREYVDMLMAGMTQNEMCEAMGISKDCFEKRLSRIKHKMRTNTELRDHMCRSVA